MITADMLSKMAAQGALENSHHALVILGHSVVLGSILMGITIWVASKVRDIPTHALPGSEPPLTPGELVTHASNVLFLCFGMSGVMILVSDNLARAFAIGAAIALVRFRIRIDQKGLSSSLLFGVLAGMACGVDRLPIAWGMTLSFGVLNIFVVSLARFSARGKKPSLVNSHSTAGAPAVAYKDSSAAVV